MNEQNKQPGGQNKQPFERWQMRAFIGENAEYFERKWGGSSDYAGWNWAAFLLGPSWLIYRRLYAEGAIAFAVLFALALIFPGAWVLFGWVFAIWGNGLYRKKLIKIIRKSEGLEREEQEALLEKKGGTNAFVAIIIPILLFLFSLT